MFSCPHLESSSVIEACGGRREACRVDGEMQYSKASVVEAGEE